MSVSLSALGAKNIMPAVPGGCAFFVYVKADAFHIAREVHLLVFHAPDFVVPTVIFPFLILRVRTRYAPATACEEVDWEVNATRTKNAMGFCEYFARRLRRDLVMQDIAHNEIEVVVWEIRIFGKTLDKVNINALVNRSHMAIANHRATNFHAPDFCIGESFFESHRILTNAATHIEDTFNFAVFRQRSLTG